MLLKLWRRHMRQRRFVTVVMLLLPGCGTRAAPATNADAALRSALLSRRARDQAVRDTFTVQLRETGTLTLALVRSMNAVDSANLAWLRQTVGSVGFPSRARVGIGGVRVMVLDTGVGISADDLPSCSIDSGRAGAPIAPVRGSASRLRMVLCARTAEH